MAAKIKKGDKVVVLTGRDKGRTGEVIEVLRPRAARWCAASTWSSATRSRRRSRRAASSPRKRRSTFRNLAIADPKDGKPTRVGFRSSTRRQEGPRRQAFREFRSMAEASGSRAALEGASTSAAASGTALEAEQFGYKNAMQVPPLDKIVLNMGIGEARQRSQEGRQSPPPTWR